MLAAIALLSLAQSVDYALAHSPTIVKQLAVVAQARSQYVGQRSQELPNVTGSLVNQISKSANYQGAYSVIGASQASVFSQNTAQIGTRYTFNGGLSHLQTLVAKQSYEQSQADLRKTQNQVTTDVTSAYYNLSSKVETVRLDAFDLQYQSVLADIAKAKEHAGVAAGVDVLSANAQKEKSRYTLQAALADAQNAREALAQLIGAPLGTQFQIRETVAQPALPAGSLEKLIAIAQSERPEVVSAQDAVLIAQLNRRSADSDLLPQITAEGSFGNQYSPTNAVFEQEQLNAERAAAGLPPITLTRGTPGFWNVGLQTSISLPFWDWGSRRANHASLNEQIAAQESNLGSARTQVELDVRQSYRAAKTALAQVSSAQNETRYALEASRIAKLQYEHGLKTLTDVLAAQQTALSAQADAFNARVAYANAIVKLRIALGIFDAHAAVADL